MKVDVKENKDASGFMLSIIVYNSLSTVKYFLPKNLITHFRFLTRVLFLILIILNL